jgi:hypothetical protein
MTIKERLLELHKAWVAEISRHHREIEIRNASNGDFATYHKGKAHGISECATELNRIITGIEKGYIN